MQPGGCRALGTAHVAGKLLHGDLAHRTSPSQMEDCAVLQTHQGMHALTRIGDGWGVWEILFRLTP